MISYRNMIDGGLILVLKDICGGNGNELVENGCMGSTEHWEGIFKPHVRHERKLHFVDGNKIPTIKRIIGGYRKMTVNKKEFADRMAENGGITKKAAFQAVGLFIQTLMEYLSEDEKVMFTNFGRFEMKYVKERVGCNP